MHTLSRKTLVALSVSAVLASAAFNAAQAQSVSATVASTQTITSPAIHGQVVDPRGQALQGALIRVVGTNREVATDRQGRFRFDNLEPGRYQVSIDYLGYANQVIEAVVTANAGQSFLFELAQAESGVERIRVVGNRDGQARALNAQRAADNIKSVVSADYLGRFPDNNVAESMQRLPGASLQRDQGEGRYVNVRGAPLEFSNVSIDGVVLPSPDSGTRAIDLDTIPADVISALELTKSITPDMDADAISGNINIVTQGALDSQTRTIRGYVAGGQNEQGNGDVRRFGATLGSRIGDSDNMGVLFSASHSSTDRVTYNIEHDWYQTDAGDFLVDETDFKDYELTRERTGFSGRFDMRPTDNSHLYLSHTYSRFEDDEYRDNMTVAWDDYTPESNARAGVANRATFEKELRHRTVVNTINSTVFGGRHFFERFNLDYSAAYSTASQRYPNRDYFLFRSNDRPAVAYDFSDSQYPTYEVLNSDGSVRQTDFNLDPNSYDFRRYERRFGDSDESEQAYAINFTVPAEWGNAYSTMKFGAKARLKSKDNDEFRYRNGVGEGAPSFADLSLGRNSLPFNGRYNNGQKISRDFVDQYGDVFENEDYLRLVSSSVTADYSASEDTIAAYAMNTLEWEQTTLLFGLRVENTRTSGSAFEFDEDTEEASPLDASNSYTNFFPSVHLRHELNNGVILRAAYSTGINRPNFENLVPYLTVEDRATGSGDLESGNPDLDPTYAHNFDLMAEYYFEPLGLLSGGVFYKDLTDTIFTARSTVTEGEFAGFNLERPENGGSGYIYGFELNWIQTLDFLPGLWSGFGVSANYTYSESSADLPFDLGSTTLPGTSRDTYNLGINYDTERFSANLAYNYRSKFIDAFDTQNPELNIYWDERGTLDFTTSFRLTQNISLFGEASNLTDLKGVRFQGDTSRIYESELFGRSWVVGLRANF